MQRAGVWVNSEVPVIPQAIPKCLLLGARRQEMLWIPTPFIGPGFLSHPQAAADRLCTLRLLVLINWTHAVVQR